MKGNERREKVLGVNDRRQRIHRKTTSCPYIEAVVFSLQLRCRLALGHMKDAFQIRLGMN